MGLAREGTKITERFLANIGRVIQRYRMKTGYSQEDLGAKIGLKGASVSRYESGKYDIKASTMSQISQVCNFELIEYVLSDADPLSEKLRQIVKMNGGISLNNSPKDDSLYKMYDMQYISGVHFNKTIAGSSKRLQERSSDILPFPLCDEDRREFDFYITSQELSDQRRMIIYAYELMKLYDRMDTPWEDTKAFLGALLKRIITTPSGQIDMVIYNYCLKCQYSDY